MTDNQKTPALISNVAGLTQNTFTPSGEKSFLATIPTALEPIYITAQKWYQWSTTGFVPIFHNTMNGILQTNIGVTITDTISKTLGGNMMLSTKDKGMEDWFRKEGLVKAFNVAIKYAVKTGTSLVKLNRENGVVYPETFRLDNFIASADRHGIVNDAEIFIDYIETGRNHKRNGHWLVEHRYFRNGKGKSKYYISQSSLSQDGTATRGLYTASVNCPAEVKTWASDHNIELDKEVDCDFNGGLGCFLLKVRDLGFDTTSAYGESFIEPIKSDLYLYEYNEANKLIDMYTGKARVLVPQQQVNAGYGPVSGLDNYLYMTVPSDAIDGGSKPEALQFEYRTDEHIRSKEEILETIASKIGVSATTIGSNLKGEGQKTATEITTETDMTASFAAACRRDFIIPFVRQVLETIFPEVEFTATFPTSGFTSLPIRMGQAQTLYQAGLATVAQSLHLIYPDTDMDEIIKMAEAIKAEKKEDNQGWLDNDDEL